MTLGGVAIFVYTRNLHGIKQRGEGYGWVRELEEDGERQFKV
jgi:hypothetical protein